jgi:cation diffusion facilitator CzcD-associated flavoprotein CzcO
MIAGSALKATSSGKTQQVDVAVVGAGFAGLYLLHRLRKAGLTTVVLEEADDVGGTWYWNRYPGAQCDIESYIYLPLLEETGYIPKEKYSFGNEIRAHARRIGEHFDLYRLACFQTEISEMRWLQDENRWLITTNRGDAMHARFVVTSSGPLNRPKLPGIPGIETFKGHSFHTSRWDYGYTGGSTEGGLTKLADKRVAIIGTGATAIQCVPHLGRHAKHLYVFQRTPSSVDVRGNKPTDPEWARTLTPGWQKRRMENFNTMFTGVPQDEDRLTRDEVTATVHYLKFPFTSPQQELLATGPARIVVDHPEYRAVAELTDEQRNGLASVRDARTLNRLDFARNSQLPTVEIGDIANELRRLTKEERAAIQRHDRQGDSDRDERAGNHLDGESLNTLLAEKGRPGEIYNLGGVQATRPRATIRHGLVIGALYARLSLRRGELGRALSL